MPVACWTVSPAQNLFSEAPGRRLVPLPRAVCRLPESPLAAGRPARLRHIQLAAARWCADAGLWREAVRYALAGGDAPRRRLGRGLRDGAGAGRRHPHPSPVGWPCRRRWWPAACACGGPRLGAGLRAAAGRARDTLSGIEADVASGRLPAQAEPGEVAAVKGLIAGLSDESEAAMAFGRQALDAAARADSWVAQMARSVIPVRAARRRRFDEATDLAARSAPLEAGGCPLFGMVYRLSMSGLGHSIAGRLGEAAALLRKPWPGGGRIRPQSAVPRCPSAIWPRSSTSGAICRRWPT